MKFNRSLLALLCSTSLVAAVYAQDTPPAEETKAPTTQKADKPKMMRLTQPWSLLTTLTAEQKEKIDAIHQETLAETKKLKEKEEAACMAVLEPAQKEELQKALEKRKSEGKGKSGKKDKEPDAKAAD